MSKAMKYDGSFVYCSECFATHHSPNSILRTFELPPVELAVDDEELSDFFASALVVDAVVADEKDVVDNEGADSSSYNAALF